MPRLSHLWYVHGAGSLLWIGFERYRDLSPTTSEASRLLKLRNAVEQKVIPKFIILALLPSAILWAQVTTSPPLMLEVVNNHVTVGMKISSVYLRLFSDGTAECHKLQFTGKEEDIVRKRLLNGREFAKVKSAVNQVARSDVNGFYGLPRMVFDSWMEWEIKLDGSTSAPQVTVSFAESGKDNRPYPQSLAELGCVILKVRKQVYGDNIDYYRRACSIEQFVVP